MFPSLKKNVKDIAKVVLWSEFKKKDEVLVDECTSFILEKLVLHHAKIEDGKERSFMYSVGKRYFQEWFFDKNSKTIFLEDLLIKDERQVDTLNILKADEKGDDLETIKTEAVNKFQELIQNTSDKNSIVVVCAIMECVLTQQDYNYQYLSLFLHRKTKLKKDALYKAVKNLGLKLSLSGIEWFDKIFEMYSEVEPHSTDSNIITEWEKRAIFFFENRHERFRSENFEARHNRVTEKPSVKSTPLERIYWMKSYEGDQMEKDYYNKFGKSFGTFKTDKRSAFN